MTNPLVPPLSREGALHRSGEALWGVIGVISIDSTRHVVVL
jgi:hypothetical protein